MTMDFSRLKGRPPYPFETIAVAVAFSPRLEAVLAEAGRLADTFQAKLLLIHVGKRIAGNDWLLQEICGKLGIGAKSTMIWQTGDPVSVLLNTCKENMVDLLILGALRRESVFRYYLGSVARGLSRHAKCSLLLLTEPRVSGTGFEKIVVSGVDHPKTMHTLNTALYFARQTGAQEIHLVKEVDSTGLAMAMSDDSTTRESDNVKEQLLGEAEGKLQEVSAGCEAGEMVVVRKALSGRPGFMIRQYAEDCHADLLAINSPDSSYGIMDRIFTHDMEYILEHLPCNMLVVHSRLGS
jgi:nucleotide-binding universal stress UspA family protein